MTEYMFVLGKNWVLSIAELIVCLENRGLDVKIVDHSRTVVVADIDQELDNESIAEIQTALGGAYKIGRTIMVLNRELVQHAYPRRGSYKKRDRDLFLKCPWLNIVWPKPRAKRISFGVSAYPLSNRDTIDLTRLIKNLSEAMKHRLLEAGARKAAYYLYAEPDRRDPDRPTTALWPQTIAKHNLLHPPNAEILIGVMDSKVYIGHTLTVYDSQLQQYRDEARPYVTNEISTSPKICRTLLNFAGVKEGDVVLDPFCGTGTLLMEAALQGIRVRGVDIDPDTVQGARTNLRWLGHELDERIDFEIARGDARQVHEIFTETVDGIATEPHLGPVYLGKPDLQSARATMKELTELYNDALKSMVKILRADGRIAMTLPVINSTDGSIRMDTRPLLKGTGLVIYRFFPKDVIRPVLNKSKDLALRPGRERIPERKRGQVVQRDIIVVGRG
ncbi:MAG: methyltransferase domain-containing protein [Candidatus Thorarchaeota archaeon]|nr:methyltransferase domain-containing protein [Candidatus Thorarchaeota archaeon]